MTANVAVVHLYAHSAEPAKAHGNQKFAEAEDQLYQLDVDIMMHVTDVVQVVSVAEADQKT